MPRLAVLTLSAALALSACSTGPAPMGDPESVPPHLRLHVPSIAACGPCHQQVYEEWSRSLHAGAWVNANIQNATAGFAKVECRPCHSPMPALATGLDRAPDYRPFNQEDGVHCLSCHGLAGGVAATRTLPDAPCAPRADPRISDADMCYPCHEPTHQAYQEYRVSNAFREGVLCRDCHMPRRTDAPGRSHGPHGGLNPAFVARALDWSCASDGRELRVHLRNLTGHKFPGEIPSRSFLVKVDFGNGESAATLLRKPNKGERRGDNRLAPDERRTLVFPLPDGAGGVRVRLLWKPFPLMADDQADVLGEWP